MAEPNLDNEEQSLDWLKALESDANQFSMVLNRVESLGILACEDLRHNNIKSALRRLAEMGEGINLCKKLTGVK